METVDICNKINKLCIFIFVESADTGPVCRSIKIRIEKVSSLLGIAVRGNSLNFGQKVLYIGVVVVSKRKQMSCFVNLKINYFFACFEPLIYL